MEVITLPAALAIGLVFTKTLQTRVQKIVKSDP